MENKDIIRAALWNKESKNGLKYSNGKVVLGGKVYRCVLFKNENKKNEKSPDFTILFQ